MRITGYQIEIDHVEPSHHGLAIHDIEKYPKNSEIIPLFMRQGTRSPSFRGLSKTLGSLKIR